MNYFKSVTDVKDGYGDTPMHLACHNGHLPVCKWLYDVGASTDISKANDWGYTPMHLACQEGHLDICKWLLLNGAFTIQNEGKTKINLEAIKTFVDKVVPEKIKALLDILFKRGQTPSLKRCQRKVTKHIVNEN